MQEEDFLEFVEEDESVDSHADAGFWNVLIVDDEEEVHTVTKMTLADFEFEDLRIDFTSAYSMMEAKKILDKDVPFSLILLDVVMEEDDAGLQLVNYIRNIVNDKNVRIVLRTGQPGDKGEAEILEYFDIAAYRNKTDLDSRLLKSIVQQQMREYARLAWYNDAIEEMQGKVNSLSQIHQGCLYNGDKPCIVLEQDWQNRHFK